MSCLVLGNVNCIVICFPRYISLKCQPSVFAQLSWQAALTLQTKTASLPEFDASDYRDICEHLFLTPRGGGGITPYIAYKWRLRPKPGGYSTKFYMGRQLCPNLQPLTLLYTIFAQKRYPFHIPSIDKWYPFTYLFRTLHPFLTAVNTLFLKYE